jgi:antibiotic biosynthesis monooxygenase (ABM) superfamily enzyme
MEKMSKKSPPFPKQAMIAIGVAMPMAYGLNISLDLIASSTPLWGIILINAIVITTYMTFMVPRAIGWFVARQDSKMDNQDIGCKWC